MSDTVEVKPLDALDMIGLEASQGEAEAQAVTDAILNPNPEPVIDPAQTWAQIPFALGGLLSMVMPELKQHYTEKACMEWGAGMALVSDKYGWEAGETISKWTPEFMLVAASLPLVLPTVAAIRARRVPADKQPGQPDKKSVVLVDSQGRDMAPVNPMEQEPGGFSVPT